MRVIVNFIILFLFLAVLALIIFIFYPKLWADILYPLKYEDLIRKSAAEFNLEPTFIAGVIFTESHFNPNAVSPVGARGLMQIMPGTSGSIAAALGDKDFNTEKLFDPVTNIRYGSYYLRAQLDKYNSDVDAVLAAYNAGPAVGDRYAVSRAAPIPQETSAFIIKVKNAQDMYKKLYGENLEGLEKGELNVAERLKVTVEPSFFQRIFGVILERLK